MNCEQCRRHLSVYLDAELPAEVQPAFASHLEGCAACRTRLEREARADQAIRAKLAETRMPAELWNDIRVKVHSRARVVRFPLRWPVALAASIALLAVAGLYVSRLRTGGTGEVSLPVMIASVSVADLLQEASPRFDAFQDPPAEDVAARLREVSHRVLGASVHIDAARAGGHPLTLVAVKERADAAGRNYVEVRLNCCGRPVLLALAKRDSCNCISELRAVTGACEMKRGCPHSGAGDASTTRTIKIQSQERGGVIIAAAAAEHTLDGVWAALDIEPIG